MAWQALALAGVLAAEALEGQVVWAGPAAWVPGPMSAAWVAAWALEEWEAGWAAG